MRRLRELARRPFALFADVRAEETADVALLLANLFVVLVAFYVLKTVREPLILMYGGAELKAYAAGAQAVVLVGWVPLYGWLAARLPRMQLILGLNAVFMLCIEVFWVLARLEVPWLGFAFYLWAGLFSVSAIAQFWSYANDLYDRGAGERLFPVIALGGTLGAPVGSAAAAGLFEAGASASTLMQVAVVLLAASTGLYVVVERRTHRAAGPAPAPLSRQGAFQVVFSQPYVLWIAVFIIALNLVNTTGEYILASFVEDAAAQASLRDPEVDVEAWIGSFYGGFYSSVNIAAVLAQALLVSRLVRWTGLAGLLLALPLVSFTTYSLVGAGAGLAVLRWMKAAENATDYSIVNTARAMLWLPTSRVEKYKAKQAIDTFFVRVGDVLAAGLVFVGTTWLGLGPQGFAGANLIIVGGWVALAGLLWRGFNRRSGAAEPAPEPPG